MQEITHNIYIDHNAIGLVTGVIRTPEGSILVDPPVRMDDVRSWRGATAKMIMGDAKFLVLLDTNFDRILTSKGCDCALISQMNPPAPTKSRQSPQRPPEDAQAASDGTDATSSTPRWNNPEIWFSDTMNLHLASVSVQLEHHFGANSAGIWVHIPKEKVIFVGDTVLVDQPPFLAYANLPLWLEELDLLASRAFRGYQIISSRSGLVTQAQVQEMARKLVAIQDLLSPLVRKKTTLEEYLALIPEIMNLFQVSPLDQELYLNRLQWDLTTWFETNIK